MSKSFDELLESVNVGDTVTGLLKADLKTTHHQELQKAREEERERIMRWTSENYSRSTQPLYAWVDAVDLQKFISNPNQSELDQPDALTK